MLPTIPMHAHLSSPCVALGEQPELPTAAPPWGWGSGPVLILTPVPKGELPFGHVPKRGLHSGAQCS